MVLNLPHLPLETSLVFSAGRLSCGSRPQGKSPPSRSEIRASLQTGYPEKEAENGNGGESHVSVFEAPHNPVSAVREGNPKAAQ